MEHSNAIENPFRINNANAFHNFVEYFVHNLTISESEYCIEKNFIFGELQQYTMYGLDLQFVCWFRWIADKTNREINRTSFYVCVVLCVIFIIHQTISLYKFFIGPTAVNIIFNFIPVFSFSTNQLSFFVVSFLITKQ